VVSVEPLAVSDDTPDWMLGSFWAHPERVLDAEARAATSGFARMDAPVVDRVVEAVRRDLESGAWSAATATCGDCARSTPGCGCSSARRRSEV